MIVKYVNSSFQLRHSFFLFLIVIWLLSCVCVSVCTVSMSSVVFLLGCLIYYFLWNSKKFLCTKETSPSWTIFFANIYSCFYYSFVSDFCYWIAPARFPLKEELLKQLLHEVLAAQSAVFCHSRDCLSINLFALCKAGLLGVTDIQWLPQTEIKGPIFLSKWWTILDTGVLRGPIETANQVTLWFQSLSLYLTVFLFFLQYI